MTCARYDHVSSPLHILVFTNTYIIQAAEKSLEELKGLRAQSEAQISDGLFLMLSVLMSSSLHSARTCPAAQLRQPVHYRLWHEKCQVHWHRNRLSTAAYRLSCVAKVSIKPGLGGLATSHLCRPRCPAQDSPGIACPAIELLGRCKGGAPCHRPECLLHPSVEQECHCQQHICCHLAAAGGIRF